jgi:hypothetical protein
MYICMYMLFLTVKCVNGTVVKFHYSKAISNKVRLVRSTSVYILTLPIWKLTLWLSTLCLSTSWLSTLNFSDTLCLVIADADAHNFPHASQTRTPWRLTPARCRWAARICPKNWAQCSNWKATFWRAPFQKTTIKRSTRSWHFKKNLPDN